MCGVTTPRVSVLLPVRDAGPHLAACLDSLARQSMSDFEVVAVDDGSTDGSDQQLRRWAGDDPRRRLIRQGPQGLVAALNRGLAACRAPLVARMDGDDLCHPRRLELQLDLLARRPDIGVVSCRVRHFPGHQVGKGFRLYEDWLNSLLEPRQIARERFVESPVAHPSVVVRKPLLLAAGGYRDMGWPEDHDLWLRLLANRVVFAKLPQHLLFWREHSNRLTHRDRRYTVRAFLRCKAHFLLRGPLARCQQAILWGAGQTGRRLLRYLLEGGAPVVALIDIDPAKIGRQVRGLPVLGPDQLPRALTPNTVVLTAVAARGARHLIRGHLNGIGLVEGHDYWCAA